MSGTHPAWCVRENALRVSELEEALAALWLSLTPTARQRYAGIGADLVGKILDAHPDFREWYRDKTGPADPDSDAAALAALDTWYGGITGHRWSGKGGRPTLALMKDALAAAQNPPEPDPGRLP